MKQIQCQSCNLSVKLKKTIDQQEHGGSFISASVLKRKGEFTEPTLKSTTELEDIDILETWNGEGDVKTPDVTIPVGT